jgi:hypothetical protein
MVHSQQSIPDQVPLNQAYPQQLPGVPPNRPYQMTMANQNQYQQPRPMYPQPMVQLPVAQPISQTQPPPPPQQVSQQTEHFANPNILPDGVEKPEFGICILCDSDRLEFYDNGDGRCPNCGRTFNWLDKQLTDDTDSGFGEENPFIVKPDEILPLSERKAEVNSEDEEFYRPKSSVIELDKNVKVVDSVKESRTDEEIEEELTNEIRLEMLEDRFGKGEISEGLYESLRNKLVKKIILELEDKLISGTITEEEFNKKKAKL